MSSRDDAVAVVIDNHTGRVRAQFTGICAEEDARAIARLKGVDCMSSTSVVTGEAALKAMKAGRI